MKKPTRKNPTERAGTSRRKKGPAVPISIDEAIRRRAYELSQERAGSSDPLDDWLRAEREIMGEQRFD
jgi:hypothetical protein